MKDYFAEEVQGNTATVDYFAQEVAPNRISADSLDKLRESQVQQSILEDQARNPYKTALNNIYQEGIAPLVSAASTGLTLGFSKEGLGAVNPELKGMITPEQQTLPGKAIRGLSEGYATFAGLPAKMVIGGINLAAKKAPQYILPAAKAFQGTMAQKVATNALGGGISGLSLAAENADPAKQAQQVAMGLGVGALIPVGADKVGKYLRPIEEKAQALIKKNAKVYRHILNPGKGIIQDVEIKSGKNIDDYMDLAAEENLVINQKEGKINTELARKQIGDRTAELNAQLDAALSTNTSNQFNLREIGERAKDNLRRFVKDPTDLKNSLADVDEQIQDAINLYGSDVIDGVTANRLKSGKWSKGYDALKPNSKKVARAIGWSIKDAIEQAYPDQVIRETNERLGKFLTLEKILQKTDGQVVQGGKLGGYFAQTAGTMIGGAVGHAINPGFGTAAGAEIGRRGGRAVNQIVNDPARITQGLAKEPGVGARLGSNLGDKVRKEMSRVHPEEVVRRTPINRSNAINVGGNENQLSMNPTPDSIGYQSREAVPTGNINPELRTGIGYSRSAEGRGRPQPQPYAGNEYGVTGKKVNQKQRLITSDKVSNQPIAIPQSIDDIERYIQGRYEAGASQNELDILEEYYSKQVFRAERNQPLQKPPQVVESSRGKSTSLPQSSSGNEVGNRQPSIGGDSSSSGQQRTAGIRKTSVNRRSQKDKGTSDGTSSEVSEAGKSSKKLIPRKKDALGNRGSIDVDSSASRPQDFATAEEYVASKLTELRDAIRKDNSERNLKVLNENGLSVKSSDEVITMYHGTEGKNIKSIEKNGINTNTYLASDKKAAQIFAGRTGTVIEIRVPVSELGSLTKTTMANTEGVTAVTAMKLRKDADGVWRMSVKENPSEEIPGIGLPRGTTATAEWEAARNPNFNREKFLGATAATGAIGSTLIPRKAEASTDVDMNKIYSIESSDNPKAHNKSSNAKGLGQITPIVLKEWNNFHPKESHTDNDLFNPEVNKKISSWYMNKRIPQMLKAKKLADTIENRLVAYNAGIGRVGKILPKETADYIKKYNKKKAS